MKKKAFAIIHIAFLWLAMSCDRVKERKEVVPTYPVTQPISVDTAINREFVAQITDGF